MIGHIVRVAQEVILINSLNTTVHSRISVRSNFCAKRVINAWNGLPADPIDFSSFPKFERSLQHYVLTAS